MARPGREFRRCFYLATLALLTRGLYAQTPAARGYVDPSACAGCHRKIAETYALTGMARSFRAAADGLPLPEFTAPSWLHRASDERFTLVRRNGTYAVRREAPPGRNPLEVTVDFVLGSGRNARSYLHRTPDHKLVEFPVAWYAEDGGHWGMSPGYDRATHQGFSRTVSYRCMFCHNGYPGVDDQAASWESGVLYPDRLPQGIDCQRCHGGGRDHIDAARRGAPLSRIRELIVHPARLSPQRRMEVCEQCHLESTSSPLPDALLRTGRTIFSYRPGEPLSNFLLFFDHAPAARRGGKFEIVSAAYRLRQSSCFQQSNGALDCTTCHDPHRASSRRETVAKTVGVCGNCHRDVHSGTKRQDCVTCHMPGRRTEDVIHVSMTDHWIHAHPETAQLADPVRETVPLPYAGEVALYYPGSLPDTWENQLDLAIAQVKHLSNLSSGLARLQDLLDRWRPRPGRPYFELAEALRKSRQPSTSIAFYEQASAREPGVWQYHLGLAQALHADGRQAAAISACERALSLSNDRVPILLECGAIHAEQGHMGLAADQFQKAVSLNGESAEALARLGNLLLRTGEAARAEISLREAVRLEPESPSIRINLAGVLIPQGKLAEAETELQRALATGPVIEPAQSDWYAELARGGSVESATSRYRTSLTAQLAPVHVNLGTIRMMRQDREGAVREYRLAVVADPDSAVALTNLGMALLEQAKNAEARPLLERAVAIAPDLSAAHLHLGRVLLALGETANAVAHLKRASASSEPRVRAAALELLRGR